MLRELSKQVMCFTEESFYIFPLECRPVPARIFAGPGHKHINREWKGQNIRIDYTRHKSKIITKNDFPQPSVPFLWLTEAPITVGIGSI